MNEELISRLRKLQQIAGVMRGLMHEAGAYAPPRSHGKDATGAVTVVLDAEGSPLRIDVAADWRRRLGDRTLGTAVMDAYEKACLARTRIWAKALQESAWAKKVERMMATGPDPSRTPDVQAPELFRRKAEPRPLGDLADEMVKSFDGGRSLPAAARFHGANRGRTVAITLGAAGLTGCLVDGAWAARQSGSALSSALGEALASARTAARAARTSPARNLDTLLDEAVSLLNDPERLGNS